MAFEYVVDRESEFGTVTFRSIDINKIHKPSKKLFSTHLMESM